MLLPRIVQPCCSISLLFGFICFAATADLRSGEANDPQPAVFERLAEVFTPPGTPDIKGKPWVVVDTGPANCPSELSGWLIEDRAQGIVLLDWYGELHKLRKPATAERRPAIKEEKDGGFLLSTIQAADHSVAWKIRAEDYAAKSKKFLADGLPRDKDIKDVFGMVNQRFGLAGHVVGAARYAQFAYRLGQKEHAAELYAHARKAQEEYANRYLGGFEKPAPLYVFVADQIASSRSNGAVYSAHNGTPRKELLKEWEQIAAIPHHTHRDEAKAMVKHYQSLLEEDARSVEPEAGGVAKLTTEKKVAYWLYHLRDLDVGQWSDPGHCRVFGDFGFALTDEEKKRPNPAVELKKLGMAAVPQLIAHLDDPRPTRCEGHWRSYWPEDHYLLRYGDCCQQIFESITGHAIFQETTTVSYPIHDGEGKRCKEKAEKWWLDYQRKRVNGGNP